MDNVGGITSVTSATVDGVPMNISIQTGGGGAVSCIGWIRFTGTTGSKSIVITYNTLANKSNVGTYTIIRATSDTPNTSAVGSNVGSTSLTLATPSVLAGSGGIVMMTYNASASSPNWTPSTSPFTQSYSNALTSAPYTTRTSAGTLSNPTGPTYNQTIAPGTALKVMASALWK